MKRLFVLALISFSTLAHAKVTPYSASDALTYVLASPELNSVKRALPQDFDLSKIKIDQAGEAPNNSFQISLLYSSRVPAPAALHTDCLVVAQVQSRVVRTGPGGSITASELSAPIVRGPSCQR